MSILTNAHEEELLDNSNKPRAEPRIHMSGSLEDDYDYDYGNDTDSEVQTVKLTGWAWFVNAIQDHSVKAKWKTITAAILLLVIGTVFFSIGIIGVLEGADKSTSLSLLVIGCITLIPGAYETFVFINVLRKVPGYALEDMPSYE